jgi:hypothetical protein
MPVVVMQLPDGSTCEYRLRATKWGLRLVRSCASYDLLTLVRDAGWTIREVKTEIARRHLAQVFQTLPHPSGLHASNGNGSSGGESATA